ncbi:acyl transferase domain-containing protein/phosphopantetheinyl transferase [Actinoplanes tereljensis]|uniref:Polyketide synthase n=1 Tax=Paractinoplanes tereljensis TaxID=571912 RepID=A0A919TYG3_9ACTN|nr:type I polyketide synthase [Actinoplanes tereljensis]GIF26164.1 polyketide synthase [Actinoplanes tereljensis]
MQHPAAIVGMAAILPGAGDLDTYWRNLVEGRDAITEVPAARWGGPHYDPAQSHRPDRLYCNRGGIVDEFATFQPLKYGIMPNSVDDIEPDQLLMLDVATAAIEDAGGTGRMPDADRIGVIVGRGGTLSPGQARHAQRVRLPTQMLQILRELLPELTDEQIARVRDRFDDQLGEFHPEGTIGLVPNLAASRVANRLNLRGPAYTLDAACASSLLAVDQGISELAAGKLDLVLAGGVHHVHDISFWSVFSQLKALSQQGRIRPFDADADGLLIGEGTGIVVLKRLEDAERDGDRIYSVIRGTGVSSDGRSASMFNPATSGQVLALRRAWQAAGLDPRAADALGLLEAHGTATPTGDAAELTSVAEVFGPHPGGERAVIGSVKSMIGHAMPAAGIAGLIKAALAVHHGVQLPTLHVDRPRAEMAATRFEPIRAARPWESPGPRRAGVNAFGFGGINAHVILEQWTAPVRRTAGSSSQDQVLRLAADTPAELLKLLSSSPAGPVGTGNCRLAIADPTPARINAARKIVERGASWRGGRDVWFTASPLLGSGGSGDGKIMFVFPGVEAEFAPRTADVAALFGLPDSEWSAADLGRHGTGLVECGVLLDEALRKINIHPHAYAGHSLGEWTAARVSGLMSTAAVGEFLHAFDADAVEVSGYAFAAIGAGVDEVVPLLAAYPGVVLSHDNAPAQTVVNGPSDQIDRLVEDLRARRIMCQALPFRSAFHTPVFEPGLRAIGDALGRWQITESRVPVWSATLAAPFPPDPAEVAEVFVRHMVTPVRFRDTVAAMHEAGFRVFLQVGAGQLASLISDNLPTQDHLSMPVNVSRRPGTAQLRRVAAALWVEGASPDFTLLDPPPAGSNVAAGSNAAVGSTLAVGSKVAAPGAARGPAVRLDLGGPQLTLGADASQLLDRNLVRPSTTTGRDGVATRVGVVPPARPAKLPAVAPAQRSPEKRKAPERSSPERSSPERADTAAALGALKQLAEHSSAAAELAALLQETATDAVTMLSATSVPVTPSPAPGNGSGPGPAPGSGLRATPVPPIPVGVYRSSLRVSMEAMPYLLDHCFYAQPPDWPNVDDRWPVVPATTVAQHMMDAAEAAAPGRKAVAIREARFNRWLIAAPAQDVEITVKRDGEREATVVFGGYARSVVELAPAYPEPREQLWAHDPATERPAGVDAKTMYDERLMFHGPQFQGVTAVHAIGDMHVRGQVTTPAAKGALLDNALQLIGNWIITTQATRTVALPVRLGRVSFHGPHPAAGTVVECVCRIRSVDHEQIVGDCQLVVDGKLWARIEGVVDRRFDSHPTARPAERFPSRYHMSEEQPEGWTLAYDYWTDLVTRGMAARGILGAAGAAEYEAKPPAIRKSWLLGRIAVKDAVRFRQWAAGHRDVFPIELTVTNEPNGRPRVRVRPGKGLVECDVSLAHSADIGVAIARPGHGKYGPGIDVTEVKPVEESTVRFALGPGEQDLLAKLEKRDLWFARFWAAKEAVAKAEGTGFNGRPRDFVITAHGPDGLTVTAHGRTYLVAHREVGNPPDLPSRRYVVAWTWGPEGPAR